MKITEHLKGQSTFIAFEEGQLWYKTDAGLTFGVPSKEVGELRLEATEESFRLVRWIRAGWSEVMAQRGEKIAENDDKGVANTPEPA